MNDTVRVQHNQDDTRTVHKVYYAGVPDAGVKVRSRKGGLSSQLTLIPPRRRSNRRVGSHRLVEELQPLSHIDQVLVGQRMVCNKLVAAGIE